MGRLLRPMLAVILIGIACGCTATQESLDGAATANPPDDAATLHEYFSDVSGAMDTRTTDWIGDQEAIELAIKKCMAERSHEYFAVLDDQGSPEGATSDPIEHAREVGFGVTTHLGSGSRGWIDWEGPNERVLALLPASEQQLWTEALEGSEAEWDEFEGALESAVLGHRSELPDAPGCRQEARRSVLGASASVDYWSVLTALLADELAELEQRMASDPRLATQGGTRGEGWRSCMRDRGHSVGDSMTFERDMVREFTARLQSLLGSEFYDIGPLDHLSTDERSDFLSNATQREIALMNRLWEMRRISEVVDVAALELLQQEERLLAESDAICRVDIVADSLERIARSEVIGEHEGRFVDDHQETLQQIWHFLNGLRNA